MQVKFQNKKFLYATVQVSNLDSFNICFKVLNFEIGASNIAFVFLEELLIQFK